jgi:hypothetical protein
MQRGITAAHCCHSMNFSNGPRSCSTILWRVLLKLPELKLWQHLEGWRSCHYSVTPTTTTWHNNHCYLHNSGTLLPAHVLFKWPSYVKGTWLQFCKVYAVQNICETSVKDLHPPPNLVILNKWKLSTFINKILVMYLMCPLTNINVNILRVNKLESWK